MDQDFHYYGTYYAARIGGNYSQKDATVIATASNFIDFLSNEKYAGYWHIVSNTEKSLERDYNVIAKVDYPRYTFQGTLSTGASGSSGLWASFHFPPGNYNDPVGTPTKIDVHGKDVAALLPDYHLREIDPDSSLKSKITPDIGKLLNRPQSALSRAMIKDTIRCLTDSSRLENILIKSAGGKTLLSSANKESILKRFGLLLLGVRAHVIGDTWAHQDWCALDHVINTYWDIDNSRLKNDVWQNIEYQDMGQSWKKVKLSCTSHENLQAAPNVPPCYVGHGWMGHFPDYSFVKYRYKPCWSPKSAWSLERDNPTEYNHAFLELCSLFSQASGSQFRSQDKKSQLVAAQKAISSPIEIDNQNNCPRYHSAEKWKEEMNKVALEKPKIAIDTRKEPDEETVLKGKFDHPIVLEAINRYGSLYIQAASDLHLFQIAADYQFWFVKDWTQKHEIGVGKLFDDTWAKAIGILSPDIVNIWG